MLKVILIMDDMPKSCHRCPLFCKLYSNNIRCKALDRRMDYYPYPKDFRQDWCPLKELPNKEKSAEGYGEYNEGYVSGWNLCLEEILTK